MNSPTCARTRVASPCVNLCRIDEASGLCVGCFRTLDEIAGWSKADDPARGAILARVERRRAERHTSGDTRSGAAERGA